MKYLDKVSLSYDRDEDRICLRSEISERQILWLWLTHRLVRQLVPHLLRATGELSTQSAHPASGSGEEGHSHADNNQPVPTSAELQENTLVHAIRLRSDSEYVELTFQHEYSVAIAKITLSLNDARKLLGGVRICFEEAAWPCDIWREVTAEVALGSSASVTLH